MDFIEGLLVSKGKQVIFDVVDKLSKSAHFLSLSHPYQAEDMAQLFLDHIFKLLGMANMMVSDRDAIFMSKFWDALFILQGVSLHCSSVFHPQSNGKTEVVNRCPETYLRCMCTKKPHTWMKWLPLVEWRYNTSFYTFLQCSLYEVLHG